MSLRRLRSAITLVAALAFGGSAFGDDPPPFALRNPSLTRMLSEAGSRGVPILVHVLSEH